MSWARDGDGDNHDIKRFMPRYYVNLKKARAGVPLMKRLSILLRSHGLDNRVLALIIDAAATLKLTVKYDTLKEVK